VKPILPLASLDGIEQAALALIRAVQIAKGGVAPAADLSLPPASPSVVSVCNEFLLAKARAGRADNYLRVSHAHLSAFCRGRAESPIATVTALEIEGWLAASTWGPVTRKNHLLTLRTLFAFAAARCYVVGNPARAVDLPLLPDRPPDIHTPAQVAEVLELARSKDLNLCRWLAVRYFAGLRGREAALLDEEAIHPDRGFLEVAADKSKTRRRRIVTILPALAAWLEVGGKLPLGDVNTKVWRLTGSLPFPFPRNVTRHSFVSYHLAEFQNAGRTALEAGHSEQVLFNHYREIVTRDEAAAFWAIRPK
jgi:integrase